MVAEEDNKDLKLISSENELTENQEKNTPTLQLSLHILPLIKEAQQQHGLRHGDYQRYRGYCSRRIGRLRKVLKLPQGDRRHFRRRDVTVTHLESKRGEPRHLCIPLMMAERAWSHAMQLRQEANTEPRKRFHLISRLRKACTHALTLLALTQSGTCDAQTQLEAEAYSAWMHGVLQFELQQWKPAMENLNKAKIVYEKLASSLPEEEQATYNQKVDELKPSLRYCAYNIGEKMADGDLLNMRRQGLIENLDTLMAQAKESRSGLLHEVEWRGRKVTVRPEKVRIFLSTLVDLDKSLSKVNTTQEQIEILENVLMDCKDAINALKDDLKADPKQKQSENAPLTSGQYLLSYLTYIRLMKTIKRNNLLVEQAEEARIKKMTIEGKKIKPQDLTRLYEIILQLFNELHQLPGFENDKVFQNEVFVECQGYKALRCYYIALVLMYLHRWREALAILERSYSYATEAIRLNLKDEVLLKKLDQLTKDIESCKFEVHANSVLEEDEECDDDKGFHKKDKRPLVERLDVYREDSQYLTKNPNIYKLPPAMEAVPCKPLFFDLASNFVEFPSLDDKTGSNKKSGAGITGMVRGFLGWGKGDK